MQVGNKIFVYGTLKQGFGANSFLLGRSNFIGEDRVNGEIYGLGGFPGFKQVADPGAPFHSEGSVVTGEVYEITDEALPKMLDNYEGYPNLYTRAEFRTEQGYNVWVYVYNGDAREDRLVPSGKWEKAEYVEA